MTRTACLLTLLAGAVLSAPVWSADYPVRPVKFVVPYPPAGTTDVLARIVAQWLTEKMGQPFVVENKAGAGNNMGTESVVNAPPDGYTMLLVNPANGINATLYKGLNFNFIRDIAPVAGLVRTPNVMEVTSSLPVKTVAEFIAYCKANPGKLNMASSGSGTSVHLSGELFKSMTGCDMVHVPYKGGGPMLIDLMGGQIPIAFDNLPSSMAHIRAGKIRALAITTTKRWPGAPEIPTLAEAGVPGYESAAWFGLLAPAGTPAAAVALLQRHVAAILRQPEVEAQFVQQGAEAVGNTPQEFAQLIAAELQKWTQVVAATGVKLE